MTRGPHHRREEPTQSNLQSNVHTDIRTQIIARGVFDIPLCQRFRIVTAELQREGEARDFWLIGLLIRHGSFVSSFILIWGFRTRALLCVADSLSLVSLLTWIMC